LVSILKKVFRIIELTLGVVIPSITFIIMFGAFCLQIFSRYILNHQFEWTYEYTVIGFMWTVVFGSIYASKQNEHVSFSLIYDRFGPKGRAIMTLAADVFILVAFCIMYVPVLEYIKFIGIKTTPVLKVPFDVIYAPFILFITFSGIYIIRDMVLAVKTLSMPREILQELEKKRKENLFLANDQLAVKEGLYAELNDDWKGGS
jgi:TRAP-type C4-dicarboxylate transport system permease small subunit